MNLTEQRQAQELTQTELAAKLENQGTKVDKSLLSRFENYVCLPTPETLKALCQVLECNKLDLYDIAEIDLISDIPQNKPKTAPVRQKSTRHTNIYNLAVRLDRSVLQVLNKRVLQMFGYKDITDFVNKCVDRLIKRYNKKVAADAGTPTSDQGNS
jgi:transcriptional regulator with XRE-family HTH domain